MWVESMLFVCLSVEHNYVSRYLDVINEQNQKSTLSYINPLTPELNPSAQRWLTKFFTGDFASWTVHFVNICVKNQQMQQLLTQFIN
jgi:hypothetical protein